ncbi:ABC transporter permease [Chloroflexota bacterium]
MFFGMRLLPGDAALLYLSQDEELIITEERLQAVRHEFGLDRPLIVQYVDWLGDLLQGDLGTSIYYAEPVWKEILLRLPITLHLSLVSLVLSSMLGIPAGVVAAIRRNTWVDTLVTSVANIGVTVPIFWLGILFIYLFGLQLNWLPIYGHTSPFEDFWMSTRQAILPVICLTVGSANSLARQSRSAMLEVIRQDYIRTAWSKGLTEKLVITRHALKNGLIPVITLVGIQVGHVVGGSVLVETVFTIPGVGRLGVWALQNQDYPVVQGVILIIAASVVFANFLVDISYGWLDPRIRYD